MILVHPAGATDVNGTLAIDPTRLSGTNDLDQLMLYTPNTLEPGSSMSHWDVSATPDLLMEPSYSPAVPLGEVDLTLPHFRDLGWPQGTSVITIRVKDPEDEGFNDPTVVPSAPNNPGGTTLGGQRLAALQWVAGVWASQLGSGIEVNIESSFGELDCGPEPEDGAVLAAAGAQFLFFDFPNAPRRGTWYHGALAEALADEDLSTSEDGFPPEAGELIITFNRQIDEGCLAEGFRYYYGLDGNPPPGQIAFTSVALHEMGHGLGFANFVNEATGSPPVFSGLPPMPDIYSCLHLRQGCAAPLVGNDQHPTPGIGGQHQSSGVGRTPNHQRGARLSRQRADSHHQLTGRYRGQLRGATGRVRAARRPDRSQRRSGSGG